MKFGILTFHNTPNYGASLQAYALCRVIREMGYDCEIIDYYCESIARREGLTFQKSSNIVKSAARFFLFWPKHKKRIHGCNRLLQTAGMVRSQSYDPHNIAEANKVYDGFISGSDMIWELDFTDDDFNYYLAFAEADKAKLAYGSSARTAKTEWLDRADKYLRAYDMIGVREQDVYELLHDRGIEASFVSDPTMLIEPDEWKKLARQKKRPRYVLVYMPDENALSGAKKYAQAHGLPVYVLKDLFCFEKGSKSIRIYTPADWMGMILGAEAVFTTSYHGTLFSIYFKKRFWLSGIYNKTESLLQKLGLMDRHLTEDADLDAPIDYEAVSRKREAFRQESLAYLQRALGIK